MEGVGRRGVVEGRAGPDSQDPQPPLIYNLEGQAKQAES